MRKLGAMLVAAGLLLVPPAAFAFHGFHSPSGNIGCILSKKFGVRCDIRDHDWTAPPKPANCDLDYGGGLSLGKHGKGHFFCAGDTVLHSGGPLAYGDTTARGRFKCTSLTTGMKCVNVRSGHGFKLSREQAKRF